jgi:hypothetical protein
LAQLASVELWMGGQAAGQAVLHRGHFRLGSIQ